MDSAKATILGVASIVGPLVLDKAKGEGARASAISLRPHPSGREGSSRARPRCEGGGRARPSPEAVPTTSAALPAAAAGEAQQQRQQ